MPLFFFPSAKPQWSQQKKREDLDKNGNTNYSGIVQADCLCKGWGKCSVVPRARTFYALREDKD